LAPQLILKETGGITEGSGNKLYKEGQGLFGKRNMKKPGSFLERIPVDGLPGDIAGS